MADRSPGVRKVLKSEREVERVPPGVADHIALGIAAGAGLVAAHVADRSLGRAKFLKARGKLSEGPRELRITSHWE